MFKKDKSISMSLPQEYELHGVRIWKLPNGQYLKALQACNNLPELLLKNCFPGMKPDQVVEELKALNEDTLYQILGRLIQFVPEQFFRLLADLTGADYEHLVNKLTPKETLEVIQAFWEMNDMRDFFHQIKAALLGNAVLKKSKFGFKNFLLRH